MISDYRRMSNIISSDRRVINYSQLHTFFSSSAHEIEKSINSLYSIYGESLNVVSAYFPNSQSVITMSRSLDEENLNLFFNSYPEIAPSSLEKFADMASGLYLIHENDHYWTIYKPVSTPVYIMSEINMKKFISRALCGDDSIMFTWGTDTQLIYTDFPDIDSDNYSILFSKLATSEISRINHDPVISRTCSSEIEELYLFTSMSISQILQIRTELAILIMTVLATTLVAVLILLGRLRRAIFLPLDHLMNVTGYHGSSTEENLSHVAIELQEGIKKRDSLIKQNNLLLPMAIGQTLVQLNDADQDADQYVDTIYNLASMPPDKPFYIFSIHIPDEAYKIPQKQQDTYNALQSLIQSLLPNTKYLLAPIDNVCFCMIIIEPDAAYQEEITNFENALQDLARGEIGTSLFLTQIRKGSGSSDFYSRTKSVFKDISFVRFWGIKGESTLSEQDFIHYELESFGKLIHRFFNSLNVRNYETAQNELEIMIARAIPTGLDNISIARYRIYAISTIVISLLKEQFLHEPEFFESLHCNDLIEKSNDITAFRNIFRNIFSLVTEHQMSASLVTTSNQKMEEIHTFIIEHYRDNGLSVSSLAEHFNMNVSYLSRSFKETYSINVLEYIHSLRIEEAKQLLTENMPIQEVAVSVGFWDTQGLSRAFKKAEGISPGEFKRMSQKLL